MKSQTIPGPTPPVSFDELLDGDPRAELLTYGADSVVDFLVEVQARLDKKQMSQAEFARRLGVKRSQLNRWLRHESGLNAKIMFQMARAMGFDLAVQWIERRPMLKVLNGGASKLETVDSVAVSADSKHLWIQV